MLGKGSYQLKMSKKPSEEGSAFSTLLKKLMLGPESAAETQRLWNGLKYAVAEKFEAEGKGKASEGIKSLQASQDSIASTYNSIWSKDTSL